MIKNTYILLLLVGLLFTSNISLYAQKRLALSIGDSIPTFSYGKWIKGSPITQFKNDRLYILEFWATWCIPCIAAMPHLSKVADDHPNDLTVIGVDVMEKEGTYTAASLEDKVKAFVKKNADKMHFDVIMDDDVQTMKNKWLHQAGINAIPTTMIVRNNQLLWIGHPNFLDSTLTQILAGKYNMLAAKQKYERTILQSKDVQTIFRRNMAQIDSAEERKDYEGAIVAGENAIAQNFKSSYPYRQRVMQILIEHFTADRSVDYLRTTIHTDTSMATALAAFVATESNASTPLCSYAAELLEKYAAKSSYTLDRLATLQSRIGEFDKAAKNQQEVLDILLEAKKKTPSLITDNAIDSCREKVAVYQSKIKK